MRKHQFMYTSKIKNKISILYQLTYFLWEIIFVYSETAFYYQESPDAAGYEYSTYRGERGEFHL